MSVSIDSVYGAQPYIAERRFLNLDPILPVFRRILEEINFSPMLRTTIDCLDSGPFSNVSLVSFKSIPYAYSGDRQIVKEFENGVSCRLRYLEAALTSTCAAIYNFVFGVFFSVASLVTLGQVKLITDQMRKHWTHTALAVASLGISCVGVVSPEMGIKANVALGFAVCIGLVQWMQGDVLSRICNAYQHHRQNLRLGMLEACEASNINGREFDNLFNYLDTHLTSQRVKSFSEFVNVLSSVRSVFPSFTPAISRDRVMYELEELLFGLRDVQSGSSSSIEEYIGTYEE